VDRDVRKGQNEAWFREVNERLEDRAVTKLGSAERFRIVCECSAEECAERILISVGEYEAVRAEATTFAILPGHTDPSCERTVTRRDGYIVVEKLGEAAMTAVIENPRTGQSP
jgi:hypothetical protein